MLPRILNLTNEIESSIFLFGARQTAKSTILRQQFPNAIYIDLLDSSIKERYRRNPTLLYEMLNGKPEGTLVIIDEIPEVPALLDEVHRLIVESGLVSSYVAPAPES